jgi:hypothetical protein
MGARHDRRHHGVEPRLAARRPSVVLARRGARSARGMGPEGRAGAARARSGGRARAESRVPTVVRSRRGGQRIAGGAMSSGAAERGRTRRWGQALDCRGGATGAIKRLIYLLRAGGGGAQIDTRQGHRPLRAASAARLRAASAPMQAWCARPAPGSLVFAGSVAGNRPRCGQARTGATCGSGRLQQSPSGRRLCAPVPASRPASGRLGSRRKVTSSNIEHRVAAAAAPPCEVPKRMDDGGMQQHRGAARDRTRAGWGASARHLARAFAELRARDHISCFACDAGRTAVSLPRSPTGQPQSRQHRWAKPVDPGTGFAGVTGVGHARPNGSDYRMTEGRVRKRMPGGLASNIKGEPKQTAPVEVRTDEPGPVDAMRRNASVFGAARPAVLATDTARQRGLDQEMLDAEFAL